jgi:hypothetical protein
LREWRERERSVGAAEEHRRLSSSECGHFRIERRGQQRKARPARRRKTGSYSDGDSAGRAGDAEEQRRPGLPPLRRIPVTTSLLPFSPSLSLRMG